MVVIMTTVENMRKMPRKGCGKDQEEEGTRHARESWIPVVINARIHTNHIGSSVLHISLFTL